MHPTSKVSLVFLHSVLNYIEYTVFVNRKEQVFYVIRESIILTIFH